MAAKRIQPGGNGSTPHSLERKRAIALGVSRARTNPLQLMKALKDKKRDALTLTREERKAVLILMGLGKNTSSELGVMLGCTPDLIRQLNREIRQERGSEVTSWTREEILGSMVMAAEKCSAMAYEQEDAQLAWAIERDKVKLLKEVGILEPTSAQEGIRLTIEALGAKYERATGILATRLDPRLTGKVVNEDPITLLALPNVIRGEGADLEVQDAPGADQDV